MNYQKKLIIGLKKLLAPLLYRPSSQAFSHQNVPYYCQWESRQLAADILAKKIKAEDDPLWKNSGAASAQEYSDWSWTACGMACLKMILEHSVNKKVPLVTLGKQCLSYGGYRLPLESSHGLYYKPFVQFVRDKYGIEAVVNGALIVPEIVTALSQKKYVITSVSPAIRDPRSTPQQRGGHLILAVGYDLEKKVLFLHNPSGATEKSQEYTPISFSDFERFFSYKGIILYPRMTTASAG
jgi:hypothetical protein